MDTHEILKSLGRIEATQEHMKSDIADIKEGVSDYRRLKHKLIGACIIVSCVAGGLWNALLKRLGVTT